ncbi:unnamed protein product, partial [Effrenium voratum]
LDLAAYAAVLVCGSSEAKAFRDKMLSSDYSTTAVCREFAEWSTGSAKEQLRNATRRLLSTPVCRQNDSCSKFLQAVRVTLRAPPACSMDQQVLHTLMDKYAGAISDGRLQEANLQIAARVAAGCLNGDIVVSNLLARYFAMQD